MEIELHDPIRMKLESIGVIRSCYDEKFGTPRQPGLCPSAWGELVFHSHMRSLESIRGLDGFSHIWLIFGFHQSADRGWSPTVRPPRLGGNRRVGVFASRATFRPNPIGLSLVKLDEIDASHIDAPVLKLSGIDLVDGTPVYDIKPYLAYAEAVPEAAAGYAAEEIARFPVIIEASASAVYDSLDPRSQQIIRESLSLNCRPAAHAADDTKTYGVRLCGHNVRFRFYDQACHVLEIS
ncbi:MAG: tRNA (N6-threonylcarbamoyladenosine(37)-N6)-methyltransferase TrmO [Luteolibacter sp.]